MQYLFKKNRIYEIYKYMTKQKKIYYKKKKVNNNSGNLKSK